MPAKTQEITPGIAIVSDILVNHAETLYGQGSMTTAALCDLAEICQAAVLHDALLATPEAISSSTILRGLDYVRTWNVDRATVLASIEAKSLEEDWSDVRPYFPTIFAGIMRKDPVFWALFDPQQLEPGRDRAEYFLNKFPFFMLWAMAYRGFPGLTEIATKQVKTYFQNQTEESFKHYTAYAASCALMSDALGGDYIPSVIEQPLLDLVRANAPIGGVPLDRIQEVFAKHLQKAIGDVRKLWLETWRMPAIGIMILGQSKSLDEVPTKITEARDRFAKLRESIISLERQRRAAVEEGEGGMVEIYKLDEEIKAAFAAFADKVDDKRTQSGVTRNERIVSGLGLLRGLAPEVLKIAGGKITAAAFGSLGKVLDTLEFDLNVKRCLNLRLIKGLYSAATFFNLEDVRAVRGVDAIVFRHLNASELLILRQRELLRNAFELCLRMALGPDPNDAYGRYKVVGGPGEEALEVESPRLWWLMASNDRLSKRLTEE